MLSERLKKSERVELSFIAGRVSVFLTGLLSLPMLVEFISPLPASSVLLVRNRPP